jgi:antitoxin component of MazEF toxin-antitoxin module
MIRFLKILFWVSLVAIILLLIYFDDIIKINFKRHSENLFGSKVEIGETDFSVLSTTGGIIGFEIKNPEGFGEGSFVKIPHLTFKYSDIINDEKYTLILFDKIEIESLEVLKTIGEKSTSNEVIKKNIENYIAKAYPAIGATQKIKNINIRVIIKELDVIKSSIVIQDKEGNKFGAIIPEIIIKDIGADKKNGIEIEKAIEQIFSAINTSINQIKAKKEESASVDAKAEDKKDKKKKK